jgi:acyl-CoA hydrolase
MSFQKLSLSADGGLPDLSAIVRRGDAIVWGHACGEPATLIEALLAQAGVIGDIRAFAGSSFSRLLCVDATADLAISSMGAIGSLRTLAKARRLSVIPCHVGQIAGMIGDGTLPCDVALVQVAPAPLGTGYSFGLIGDYLPAAVAKARIVIAELNHRAPRTHCQHYLSAERIDYLIETDRPLAEVPRAGISDTDRAIARHAADYIGDNAILQVGIGAVPEALMQLLKDRRDLGLHSGMVGDSLVDLYEAGALTNASKTVDRGVSITGALIGTERLYRFADDNPDLLLCPSSYTHRDAILTALPRLVSVNSAIEVDLTGQVNAEQVGDAYLGGTGGQVDYVRGGARSEGGHSLIVLPSAANGNSRIVARTDGPVTTARSEVDVVITEYGAAELKGRSIAERAQRMVEIAHPDARESLAQAAHAIARRGF